MDVPKYRVVFKELFESNPHFYERCKKIKADEKLSGYSIYTPFKSIATKYSVEHISVCYYYNYMILMKGPRAKCSEFFNNGEYEKHAAEFVEKVKAMDPICISCNGVYCEDGVHCRKEAALYYYSNAMKSMHDFNAIKSMHDFQAYCNHDGTDVMVNKEHMDSEHWVKYLPDDQDDNQYTAVCCPRIRIWFFQSDLRDIDRDIWFSYMRDYYASEICQMKETEERLRECTSSLDEIRREIARIYDQFSDSEKLMVELDME